MGTGLGAPRRGSRELPASHAASQNSHWARQASKGRVDSNTQAATQAAGRALPHRIPTLTPPGCSHRVPAVGVPPRSSSCSSRTACDVLRGSETARLRCCLHSKTHSLCCSLGMSQHLPPPTNTPEQGCVSQGMSPAGHTNRSFPWRSPKHRPFLLGASRSTAGHPGSAPPPSTRSGEHKSNGAAQNWALGRDWSLQGASSLSLLPSQDTWLRNTRPSRDDCLQEKKKSISHIWQAGDDSAAKAAAVSK